MKMKIYTANRETGMFIEECKTIEEAKARISQYEEEDKKDGTFEENFYDIVDGEHLTIQNSTPKYYLANYDSRLGGDYCEVYSENLIRIDIVKGLSKIDGLTQIGRKHSSVSHMYEIEPLNEDFVILKKRDDEAVITAAEAFRGDK